LGHMEFYDWFNDHQLTMTNVWTTLNRQNAGKCCISAWDFPRGPQTKQKYPSCMQHYGTVIQDMPAHFVGWIQHEADCCKVRAKKQHRTEVSMEHKEQIRTDPALFPQVVTGDESWTNGYNPATK
jgi:hypothetical protein